jgi:hypothetical protein
MVVNSWSVFNWVILVLRQIAESSESGGAERNVLQP